MTRDEQQKKIDLIQIGTITIAIMAVFGFFSSNIQLYMNHFNKDSSLNAIVIKFDIDAEDAEKHPSFMATGIQSKGSVVLINSGNVANALISTHLLIPDSGVNCDGLKLPEGSIGYPSTSCGENPYISYTIPDTSAALNPNDVITVPLNLSIDKFHIPNKYVGVFRNYCLLFVAADHEAEIHQTSVRAAELSINSEGRISSKNEITSNASLDLVE